MSSREDIARAHAARGFTTAPRLRWVLVVGLLAANVLVFVMGVLAAIVGGGLSDWGNGAGGLGGWANELMTYFSFLVGFAAAIATFKERRAVLVSAGVFATGLLISTGFLEVGHLVDPCARGWWDFSTTVGDEHLCSSQGGEIAVRFHLLLHGASGVVAATLAAVVYRRANLFDWWPPERRPTSVE